MTREPPDSSSGRVRKRRPASLDDTLDDQDERDRAVQLAIERDVRKASAVTAAAEVAAALKFPRSRTPADEELAAAIAKVRAGMPEWALAENVAKALEALAARIDENAAADQARAAADRKRRTRWTPIWRAIKAIGAAGALAVATYTIKALIDHGDARRASAQQAAVITRTAAEVERLNAIVTADHPIVLIVAARLGMYPSPAPAPLPFPLVNP